VAIHMNKLLEKLVPTWHGLREQRWGTFVSVLCGLSYLLFFRYQRAELMPGRSDPFYIWLYARSIVFDGDVDFTNDYALCGDPFGQASHAVTPHPPNPYYLGPALFYAPVLLLVRAVVRLPATAPDTVISGCTGALVWKTMLIGPVLGALTLYLCYRIARRWVDDGPAALACAFFGLAGLLTAYAAYQPGYSHVFATFSVALLACLSLRARERPSSLWRWALAGLALAIAVLQRPPQLVYGLVPAVLVWLSLEGRRRIFPLTLVSLGGVLGVVPLLVLYRYMYGSYFANPVGADYIHISHAHPFLLLFAPHGGLFYTTPVAWIAAFGIWPALRRRSTAVVALPLMIAGAIEGFLYSASLDWHGSGTVGARRLTTLTPLFILLSSLLFARIGRFLSERPQLANLALGIVAVVPAAFVMFGMLVGYAKYTIPCCHGSSQADLYGEGSKQAWAVIDRSLGDVAVLPAAIPFAWWYDIPINRFRDATQSKFYIREFRSGRFVANRIVLTDSAAVTDGFDTSGTQVRMLRTPARVVFSPEWPFATHLVVSATADRPTKLRVGRRLAFGRVVWYGDVQLEDAKRVMQTELPIPDGGFASGPLELLFDSPDPAAHGLRIDGLRILDRRNER
jgi:hypothetical protein